MFCFQCQETTNNRNCAIRGVCGKSPEVAALQDMLVYALKGVSIYSTRARELGYSDPANFSRAFSRRAGVRPSAFRRPPVPTADAD